MARRQHRGVCTGCAPGNTSRPAACCPAPPPCCCCSCSCPAAAADAPAAHLSRTCMCSSCPRKACLCSSGRSAAAVNSSSKQTRLVVCRCAALQMQGRLCAGATVAVEAIAHLPWLLLGSSLLLLLREVRAARNGAAAAAVPVRWYWGQARV